MKVTLRGGPEENDGEVIECDGGAHIIKTVCYKTPSVIGVCLDCPRDVKHPHEILKEFFNRKYELRSEQVGDEYTFTAWYIGES